MYRTILFTVLILAGSLAPAPVAADEDYDELVQKLGESFDREGELMLRIIAQGVRNGEIRNSAERQRLLEPTDIVCSFGKPTGQHFTHVMCREFRFASDNALASSTSDRGTTSISAVSHTAFVYRVREREMRNAIDQLPGLPSMNDRLLAEGLAGLPLPQGLPSQDELDQFVQAYRGVNQISNQYDPLIATASGSDLNRLRREADDAMVAAIQSSGLSWERYNEITEHVGTHPELFQYVREHIRGG
jgi:uncharacterized protein DUF4168